MSHLDSESIRLPTRLILAAFAAFVVLVPVAAFNSYIFEESNLPLLLLLLISVIIVYGAGRIPKRIVFPGITFCVIFFVIYAWTRLDHPWGIDIWRTNPDGTRPGIFDILDLIICYALFLVAAQLSYRYDKLSDFLWFVIFGYIVAFILRNSFDITGLQQGYNLSPGYVLVTLLPFVFLQTNAGKHTNQFLPTFLLFFCVIWLALIGARTAVLTLIGFYVVLRAWPLITRNRINFYGAFWGMVLFIVLFNVIYIIFAATSGADPLVDDALVEDSSIGILQKRLGTRIEIWLQLLYFIAQQPYFGYGTDHATFALIPTSILEFSLRRNDLSAHSAYFELLYRLGAVGLVSFVLILFSIWKEFWNGREKLAVRVAAAFLLSIMFFASTGDILVLSTTQLRSGFGWIILGIGAGATLRARKEVRLLRTSYGPLDKGLSGRRPSTLT